ncbi:MAG TPA: hypothetical protein PKA00_20355 [Saprospiraceae bacterium]|nr:hypothetical protein [Saprospiraceae bacterium]HMQ85274.1 hypothetical protein [Saprospiraceae bacterium]
MDKLWGYFKKMFRQAEESSPSQPLIHEIINRSEEEKQDYERWKTTLVCRRLRDWLSDQYAIYQALPNDIDEALDFLHTPSSKGFVIHLHKTRYNLRDMRHFLDFLKEQVLAAGYRTQISDLRTYQRTHWVETIERHYLKPRSLKSDDNTLSQGYGNIMIELELRNDQVHYLRFRTTAYQDRLFEKARDFRELMQVIL